MSDELSRMPPEIEEHAADDAPLFLDHAGVAPLSQPAADALSDYAEHACRQGYLDAGWMRRIEAVRYAAARLINATSADQIAFIPNTSTGLATVAEGLPWREGDNVVISKVEYPANRYPWENLRRRGVALTEVPQLPDGRIDVEDVCDAITDRTRVVAISHVQYASGFRIALRPIADMVHRAGGYLCVDAIQSLGVIPFDVQIDDIDFVAADGHKWLLSPEGCGLLYCREDLIPLLHPPVVGWMCMADPLAFGDYRFELAETARRFEPGSYNVPGILALGASIDLLTEMGIPSVWERVDRLTGRLVDGLHEKGYHVYSPRLHASEHSGIVVFDVPEGSGDLEGVVRDLRRRRIVIVQRERRLRASPHFYNTSAQIDRLIDALPPCTSRAPEGS